MKTLVNNSSNNSKKQFCNVVLGDGKRIFNDVQIINALLKEGQKKVDFSELADYCALKKNQNFLIKRFRKNGFVPSFFVQNNFFYCVKVIRYSHRGRNYESLSCLPLCSAYGRFTRFEL